MRNLKFILLASLIILSCNNSNINKNNSLDMESPLSSVIKLISAESTGSIDEARKYIDIERVYSKYTNDTLDVENIWKEQIEFKSSKDASSKFTNHFKYYNYKIVEEINSSQAVVSFIAINKKSNTREIIYSLEKRNNIWKVIDIK